MSIESRFGLSGQVALVTGAGAGIGKAICVMYAEAGADAARYTPPGTQLAVTAAVDDQMLKMTVADNGPGLPTGAEDRIFEKFYRASPTADASRGSGLGLATCRAIAKAHGGNVTARNRPNGGAEFIVELPLVKDAPEVVVE